MNRSLACILLLCLLQLVQSTTSTRTHAVKGSVLRRTLGRKMNRKASRNMQAKQNQKKSTESYQQAKGVDNIRASKGSKAAKSSAANVASAFNNARNPTPELISEVPKTTSNNLGQIRDKQKTSILVSDKELIPGATPLPPFTLFMDSPEEPLEEDYAEVTRLTMEFLVSFLFYKYDDALESFSASSSSKAVYSKEHVQLMFNTGIKFIDGVAIPSNEIILRQIEKAFTDKALTASYLGLLHRSLDSKNPLQQSTNVTFYSDEYNNQRSEFVKSVQVRTRTHTTGSTTAAFAGAFLILVFSGYLIHGNHKQHGGNNKTRNAVKHFRDSIMACWNHDRYSPSDSDTIKAVSPDSPLWRFDPNNRYMDL